MNLLILGTILIVWAIQIIIVAVMGDILSTFYHPAYLMRSQLGLQKPIMRGLKWLLLTPILGLLVAFGYVLPKIITRLNRGDARYLPVSSFKNGSFRVGNRKFMLDENTNRIVIDSKMTLDIEPLSYSYFLPKLTVYYHVAAQQLIFTDERFEKLDVRRVHRLDVYQPQPE